MPNVGSQFAAKQLYAEWNGKNKTPNNLVLNISDFPKSWVFLGLLPSIPYITDRYGKWEGFNHKFDKGYEPLIYGDPYRRMLMIYGNLDITSQGIINRQDFPARLNR